MGNRVAEDQGVVVGSEREGIRVSIFLTVRVPLSSDGGEKEATTGGDHGQMEKDADGEGFQGLGQATPNKTTPLPLFPFFFIFYFFIYYNRSQFSKISHKFGQNF